MLLFVIGMLIIKAEPGEFRTKIKTLEDEIKAYTLLSSSTFHKENLKIKIQKVVFLDPENIKIENSKIKKIESLKELKNSVKKLIWLDGVHILE